MGSDGTTGGGKGQGDSWLQIDLVIGKGNM